MDERLHCEEVQPKDPKVEFVKKLLTKNPEITNAEIKQEFKNHSEYASTRDMAIECIITAAKGWLKNTDEDDSKLPAVEKSEDGGDIKTQALNRFCLLYTSPSPRDDT